MSQSATKSSYKALFSNQSDYNNDVFGKSHFNKLRLDILSVEDCNEFEVKFLKLVNHLMNQMCLVVACKRFRMIELEVYYHDEVKHPDPYVHKSVEQKQAGNWYFTGAGLDIVFGKEDKNIFGGILIRGIRDLSNESNYTSGPSNVLKEIFSNLGGIMSNNGGVYLDELNKNEIKNLKTNLYQSVRIGLTRKDNDSKNYINKKYRYLADMNLSHKFKDKERVVRQLLSESIIDENQVKEIMGYGLKNC